MSRTRLIVMLCVAALLVSAAIAAWKIPFWGQARESRPVAALVPTGAPHLVGPWTGKYVPADQILPPMGLVESGDRSWNRPDGVEVGVTVRRFSAPNWAHWNITGDNPQQGDAEGFDRIIEVQPRRVPPTADDTGYWCGQIDGRPGTCDNWWTWIRYGQYVVLVEAIDVPSTNTEIPPWLYEAVEEADYALTTGAPKG